MCTASPGRVCMVGPTILTRWKSRVNVHRMNEKIFPCSSSKIAAQELRFPEVMLHNARKNLQVFGQVHYADEAHNFRHLDPSADNPTICNRVKKSLTILIIQLMLSLLLKMNNCLHFPFHALKSLSTYQKFSSSFFSSYISDGSYHENELDN